MSDAQEREIPDANQYRPELRAAYEQLIRWRWDHIKNDPQGEDPLQREALDRENPAIETLKNIYGRIRKVHSALGSSGYNVNEISLTNSDNEACRKKLAEYTIQEATAIREPGPKQNDSNFWQRSHGKHRRNKKQAPGNDGTGRV